VQNLDVVQDQQRDQGVELDLAVQLADESPLAVPRLQNPKRNQSLDTFPDGDPADAQGPGKFGFGGEFAAGGPGAAEDLIAELPENLAPMLSFFMGLSISITKK
jgi:hypothetical protein